MKGTYVFLLLLLLVIGGGFFFIFAELSSLKSDLENLELSLKLFSRPEEDETVAQGEKQDELNFIGPATSTALRDETLLATAIIFNALSSLRLEPQVVIPIIVESVSLTALKIVKVRIKAFTSGTSSYSALEVRDLFEVVDLTTKNIKPSQVEGAFDSMPPKRVVAGTIIFSLPSPQKQIILQITTGENEVKHYEFDFEKKTYKEITLG